MSIKSRQKNFLVAFAWATVSMNDQFCWVLGDLQLVTPEGVVDNPNDNRLQTNQLSEGRCFVIINHNLNISLAVAVFAFETIIWSHILVLALASENLGSCLVICPTSPFTGSAHSKSGCVHPTEHQVANAHVFRPLPLIFCACIA